MLDSWLAQPAGNLARQEEGKDAAVMRPPVAMPDHLRVPGNLNQPGIQDLVFRSQIGWDAEAFVTGAGTIRAIDGTKTTRAPVQDQGVVRRVIRNDPLPACPQ